MIHKFRFENSNIVMDIHSGSIHLVDEVAYTLVEEAEKLSKEALIEKYKEEFEIEAINEAYEELMSLKEEGMLYTADQYETLVPAFLNS